MAAGGRSAHSPAGRGLRRRHEPEPGDVRGQTWQRLATAPVGVTALAVRPGDPKRAFAGTGEGRLFQSADGGVSWHAAQ